MYSSSEKGLMMC